MKCRSCHLPVIEPSVGGVDLCPWCDCGIYRDGTLFSYLEATSPTRLRLRAAALEVIKQQGKAHDPDEVDAARS